MTKHLWDWKIIQHRWLCHRCGIYGGDHKNKKPKTKVECKQKQLFCAIDVEAAAPEGHSALDCYDPLSRITSISWANDKNISRFIAVSRKRPAPTIFQSAILSNPSIVKVFWNAKYDIKMMRKEGLVVQPPYVDALLLARVVRSNEDKFGLKHFSRKYLNDPYIEEDRIIAWERKNKTRNRGNAPKYLLEPYNIKDAQNTLLLWFLLIKDADKQQKAIFRNEMKVLHQTMAMEDRGLLLDEEKCDELTISTRARLKRVAKKLRKMTGKSDFNPNSPIQIRKVIYDGTVKMEFKTDGGKGSTHKVALVASGHPIAKGILIHRELSRLKSTYLESFTRQARKSTIHPSWNQAGTKTGRYSSAFHTCPRSKESPLGVVRHLIIARPEYNLVCIDADQLEIRLGAHFSQEETLLDAISQGLDIHGETCKKIFNKKKDSPDWDKYRYFAKTLNFAIQYGCGAEKLRFTLLKDAGIRISLYEASKLIEAYKRGYPKIIALFDTTAKEVAKTGGIRTGYGRFIHVDRKKVYVAVNYLIQGTAADLIKFSMPVCGDILEGKKSGMVAQVHDELMFEIHETEKNLIYSLHAAMEELDKFSVPIVCSVTVGKRWGSRKCGQKYTIPF